MTFKARLICRGVCLSSFFPGIIPYHAPNDPDSFSKIVAFFLLESWLYHWVILRSITQICSFSHLLFSKCFCKPHHAFTNPRVVWIVHWRNNFSRRHFWFSSESFFHDYEYDWGESLKPPNLS